MASVNEETKSKVGYVNFSHAISAHPCFSEGAQKKRGRIHLPVSPICNIQCRFCRRCFNKLEVRPGVTAQLVTPEAALEVLGKALRLCPEIIVAGVAGPGDPLASDHAIRTFELIEQAYPYLIKCLSTNGLRLPEYAMRLIALGIRTVTVTVNAVDPAILPQLVAGIQVNGQFVEGEGAARTLVRAQLDGISAIAGMGAIVKINVVLVPGVNDQHVGVIAKTVKQAGAAMMNIIPLIPQHELLGSPAPSCTDLHRAREAAEEHLQVFRHCTQCRADAAGIPGVSEFRDALYDDVPVAFSHG
jgi:nitrogen fixation protein NifB